MLCKCKTHNSAMFKRWGTFWSLFGLGGLTPFPILLYVNKNEK